MFDWDDLRVFLATARAGSLSAAGKALRMDTATVGRRIVRLETALKATLLVRSHRGLQMTAAGSQLLMTAAAAETTMAQVERVGSTDQASGIVRISVSEGLGVSLLSTELPAFALTHPNVRVELAATGAFLSPSRREVDMLITLSAPAARRLVVEPLTRYQLALYTSADYLARAPEPRTVEDLRSASVVGYVDDLIYNSELRYLDEILPGLTPRLSSSSIVAQRQMVEAGGGIGVLPCFLAGGLQRVLPDVLLERRFWLCTHPDVHETMRVRIVTRWLKDIVVRRQALLAPF